jgi:hypothetical protein
MQLTRDQIVQLAPDDASAKAGQQLATTSKWLVRCANPLALWGDCQGSGSSPYKTMVDLANMAFKCSCPSRKFPCKHGLGLLLLYATNASAFTQVDQLAPQVDEWLSKRVAKAEAKETKEAKPIDEKAQQKRVESREKKVDAGIEELRLWLKDLVRTGIVGIPQNAYQFSQNITARMVDAQASGLAAQLRKVQQLNFYKDGWQKGLIGHLSKLYLLTEAYQKLDGLPAEWQQELKTLIGWTIAKEEVLAGEGIQDEWLILSKTQEEEGNLVTERIWLRGRKTQRYALILNFYAGNQLPSNVLVAGATLVGELAFFPAVTPLRALVKVQTQIKAGVELTQGIDQISEMHQVVTQALAQNPFVAQVPLMGNGMRLSLQNGHWYMVDAMQQAMALRNSEAEAWDILATTGGREFACFGLYENEGFALHGIWLDTTFHRIA